MTVLLTFLHRFSERVALAVHLKDMATAPQVGRRGPDGDVTATTDNLESIVWFDAVGRRTLVQDPKGTQTVHTFDALGSLTKKTSSCILFPFNACLAKQRKVLDALLVCPCQIRPADPRLPCSLGIPPCPPSAKEGGDRGACPQSSRRRRILMGGGLRFRQSIQPPSPPGKRHRSSSSPPTDFSKEPRRKASLEGRGPYRPTGAEGPTRRPNQLCENGRGHLGPPHSA